MHSKNLNKDIDLVGKQGHIVVIGGAGNISTAPITLLFKQVSITGAYTYNITEEELYETSCALHAGIETGWLHGRSYLLRKQVRLTISSGVAQELVERSFS